MATALAGQAERVALDRALTLLDGGASPATIAAALNHDGLKRFDGRRWHATSVLRLLQQVSTERPAPRLGRSPSTRPAVPGEALTIRLHQTEVVLNAVRAMLRVESVEHAVAVLQDTVRLLGGGTVPARSAGSDAIPVDISLGQGDPLLPVAPLQSPTRRVLERLVPGLVEDARRAVDLARQNRRLVSEADTDPLTGLGNRRRLDRVPSLRAEDCVVMLDLDHFKSVNDTHGHAVGDEVLIGFSRMLRSRLRADDLVFRLGGEEFLVIMGGTTTAAAIQVLLKLRAHWALERPLPISFSGGVANLRDADLPAALVAADAALYRAKHGGRDRFEAAADPTEES